MSQCRVRSVSPENGFSNSYSLSNHPLNPKRTRKSQTEKQTEKQTEVKTQMTARKTTTETMKVQVYTGKPSGGLPERRQGLRVVLDAMEGLHGCNVTCDNYFTSYELALQLLEITVVGTVRKNKPELPTGLLAVKGREVFSSMFVFTQETGHRLGLQSQQRWLGQPRRSERTAAGGWSRAGPWSSSTTFSTSLPTTPSWYGERSTLTGCRASGTSGGCSYRSWERLSWLRSSHSIVLAAAAPLGASQRKRYQMCPRKKDCKTYTVCRVTNSSARAAHLSIALRVHPNMGWAMWEGQQPGEARVLKKKDYLCFYYYFICKSFLVKSRQSELFMHRIIHA